MSGPRPSVVIVDDHALFRAGVRSELEDLVEVRADAGTVEEAVATVLREKPDVALLDVNMPGGGGVEVIRKVAVHRPAQRFLGLSVSDAAEDVIALIRAVLFQASTIGALLDGAYEGDGTYLELARTTGACVSVSAVFA